MAQLWTTGPADLWVAGNTFSSPSGFGAVFYLGSCESKPHIDVIRHWRPVEDDLYGQAEPADLQYQGQGAVITAALSRWNELVYQTLVLRGFTRAGGALARDGGGLGASLPRTRLVNSNSKFFLAPGPAAQATVTDAALPGIDESDAVGSLLIRDGLQTHLFITFPRSSASFYNGGGGGTGIGGSMPFGYHFFATVLVDKDQVVPGTELMQRIVQFRAVRVRPEWASPQNVDGSLNFQFVRDFVLYDFNCQHLFGRMAGGTPNQGLPPGQPGSDVEGRGGFGLPDSFPEFGGYPDDFSTLGS